MQTYGKEEFRKQGEMREIVKECRGKEWCS